MKTDRHSRILVICKKCGKQFLARTDRIRKGLGKFCSKTCYHEQERDVARRDLWGKKDLAKIYKCKKRYVACYYKADGTVVNTPYPRWWWEVNVGDIPRGMIVITKDNNPFNISPSNFFLGTKKESTNKGKQTLRADKKRWQAAIDKRANAVSKKWLEGAYKNNTGSKHWKFRSGAKNEYPREFTKSLKNLVKSRDNYQCQICSIKLYKKKSANVHHRDGNRNNNNMENLLLLCSGCHSRVHKKTNESPPIMALRFELSWENSSVFF